MTLTTQGFECPSVQNKHLFKIAASVLPFTVTCMNKKYTPDGGLPSPPNRLTSRPSLLITDVQEDNDSIEYHSFQILTSVWPDAVCAVSAETALACIGYQRMSVPRLCLDLLRSDEREF